MDPEVWEVIPDFPRYSVSNHGRVFDQYRNRFMTPSPNNHGHLRVGLWYDNGEEVIRYTRTVAPFVANAFVYVPDRWCDQVVVLNGDFFNIAAWNLAWRPNGFAWEYTHQLKQQQPMQFHNLKVRNITDGIEYRSIVEAGINEGRLFKDIWRSTYTGDRIYPYGCEFRITTRV